MHDKLELLLKQIKMPDDLYHYFNDGNLDKIFSLEQGISFSQTQDESLTKIEDVTRTFKNAEKVTVTVKPRRVGSTTLSKYLSELRGFMVTHMEETDSAQSVKNGISVSKFIENVGNKHDINTAQVTAVNVDRETLFRRNLEKKGYEKPLINKL